MGKLARLFNGPYRYRLGAHCLGEGADVYALEQPQSLPIGYQHYGPRYNIRRTLSPNTGGYVGPDFQSGPLVDLKANGVFLSGALSLQALADYEDQITKAKQ